MKFIPFLTLPLFFLSACSDLNPEDKEKPEEKQTAPEEELPLPLERPTDGIEFSSPDTTESLLTDDNKKTVTGPAPTKKPIEGDSVINVPPPLPTPSLPDE